MAWRVERDGRCVPMTRAEELLSDAAAAAEDVRWAIEDSVSVTTKARQLLAESRRQRRLRTTTLRLVRNFEP